MDVMRPAVAGPVTRAAPTLEGTALRELGRRFQGAVIMPGDPEYDEARRVWNGSIDRFPALIARCVDASDVAVAVDFGRRTGLPVAVRSGGHSFPGLSVCDGGIVIDLRAMHAVAVDAERGTVRAGAGVLLGELDAATQAVGMAVPSGSVTHTGLAGLTLGGGIGWLMRRHGLTIDQLISARLVTADGEAVTASAVENADLFWGLRGGGGNFGIVTEFEYRLRSVGPEVLSGLLIWPLEEAPDVIRTYRSWADAAPDALTTALILRRAPAVDQIPTAFHGRPVVAVAYCWADQPERGEPVVEPMRRYRSPIVDLTARRPFVEHQAMFDASFPPGNRVYSKATDVAVLADDVVDAMVDHVARVESWSSGVTAWQLGGAVGRVGPLETAFGGRSSGYLVDVYGITRGAEGFDRERAWARACWQDLARHQTGAYVNWLMDEGEERVRAAYGPERYRRLQALKGRFDPDNVFRLNQNIVPA